MFSASEKAVNNLFHYLEANNMQTGIRITCRHGKNTEPRLGIMFGAAKENDQTFELQGVRFVVNRDLLEKSGGITLDYNGRGPDKGYKLCHINPTAVCAH
jgi:Fe-S cluster assembly iron-binding protein IscA